jgi:hypothetical protein
MPSHLKALARAGLSYVAAVKLFSACAHLTEAAKATHARVYALKHGNATPYTEKPRPN